MGMMTKESGKKDDNYQIGAINADVNDDDYDGDQNNNVDQAPYLLQSPSGERQASSKLQPSTPPPSRHQPGEGCGGDGCNDFMCKTFPSSPFS